MNKASKSWLAGAGKHQNLRLSKVRERAIGVQMDAVHQRVKMHRAKIRHIKIEIDMHSVFLGHVPYPSQYTGYSAIGPGGILGPGDYAICDAINMMARAGGSLTSFEVSQVPRKFHCIMGSVSHPRTP